MSERSLPPENNSGYEHTDAKLGPVLALGVGIVLLGLLAHGVSLFLFDYFRASTNRLDPPLPPLAAKERPKLPQDLNKIPAPRLQLNEKRSLGDFRKQENEKLDSYDWIDRERGKIRIPIENAMRILADPVQAAAHGIKVAKEQTKGRK